MSGAIDTVSPPAQACYVILTHLAHVVDSDVVFVQLPMQPMMIVGSVKAASDLFDKRSQIYSDRARCLMAELYVYSVTLRR